MRILISGGARGIGAACVRGFASDGHSVAFIYRSAHEAAEKLADECGATAICADISKPDEAREAGSSAARYVNGGSDSDREIKIKVDGKIRYTVPHIIRKAEDTTVYFRVSGVFENKRIVVRYGDEEILSKKRIKMAPGEMESVKIGADALKNIDGGVLEFSVE